MMLNAPRATAAAVPDAESLRRAVLQASWRRDRWVARRRLAWRWTLFYLQAHGWLLLVAALLWGGWAAWRTAGAPAISLPLAWPPALSWTKAPTPAAPPPSVTAGPSAAAPVSVPHAVDRPLPATDELTLPPLRWHVGPLSSPASNARMPVPPGAADPAPLTDLKFESSIQRKEM